MKRFAISTLLVLMATTVAPATWLPADGDARDALNGNDGVLLNGATFAEGIIGSAFAFDGIDDQVVVPRSRNTDPPAGLTIAFWMRADPENAMLDCCQGLVATDFYLVEISGGSDPIVGINFGVNTGSGFIHTSDANAGGAVVSAGEWHHVAATYNGERMQLYIDGQPWGLPAAVTGTVEPMLATSFLSIGSEDGRTVCEACVGTRYFHGEIDEVFIYPRALAPSRIRHLAARAQ